MTTIKDRDDLMTVYGALLLSAGIPKDERAAFEDAVRSIARDIPDPVKVAELLQVWAIDALTGAVRATDQENAGCWRLPYNLSKDQEEWFRKRSMIDLQTPHLTAFGCKVRKAVLAMEGP